jgi:hypothetical protein
VCNEISNKEKEKYNINLKSQLKFQYSRSLASFSTTNVCSHLINPSLSPFHFDNSHPLTHTTLESGNNLPKKQAM